MARPRLAAWACFSSPALGETIDLRAKGGSGVRPMTTAYPEKGRMILQRTRPLWLETPFDVSIKAFSRRTTSISSAGTGSTFPTSVDVASYALRVRGCVNNEISLSLNDLLRGMPRVELRRVAECAGNSRLYFEPRVAGAQWANGSMSNARWTGVRLKDVLDRAGSSPAPRRCVLAGLTSRSFRTRPNS